MKPLLILCLLFIGCKTNELAKHKLDILHNVIKPSPLPMLLGSFSGGVYTQNGDIDTLNLPLMLKMVEYIDSIAYYREKGLNAGCTREWSKGIIWLDSSLYYIQKFDSCNNIINKKKYIANG